MTIKVMPPELAIKIAAGEVVERPAAIIKELVDNAIDAGARTIRIEIEAGGQELIRVVDDGAGIPQTELATAFLRHATSKISQLDDLFQIATLGFRGEALPSIASVSKGSLASQPADQAVGYEVQFEGGELKPVSQRGMAQGTIFTVRDLFYNVPARLKFLKSPPNETGRISTIVTDYALAYPGVKFTLVSERKATFQSPGSGELKHVIAAVYGASVSAAMIPVGNAPAQTVEGSATVVTASDEAELPQQQGQSAVRVWGYASLPSTSRSNREYIRIFVNHRPIESQSLTYAVTEAYRSLLLTGRFPIVVLNIELDPAVVDVNVHPAKIEVKFQDERSVFQSVSRAVRAALNEYAAVPQPEPVHDQSTTEGTLDQQAAIEFGPISEARPARTDGYDVPTASRDNWQAGDHQQSAGGRGSTDGGPGSWEAGPLLGGGNPAARSVPVVQTPGSGKVLPSRQPLPPLRIVGQTLERYIVAEGPDGAYVIDQHAAAERILYERLLEMVERSGGKLTAMPLPAAVKVELSTESGELSWLEARQPTLRSLAVNVEQGEGDMVQLTTLPELLVGLQLADPPAAVRGLLNDLLQQGRADLWHDTILISLAAHFASALQPQEQAELRELLTALEECQMPRADAHGRPTLILISTAQLEREFKRTGF